MKIRKLPRGLTARNLRKPKFWMGLFAIMIAAYLFPHTGQVIEGEVSDGDSFTVAGYKIRLQGVDAPESDQTCIHRDTGKEWPCGKQARAEILKLVSGKSVSCNVVERDKYQRYVAHCYVIEGESKVNINAAMILGGWAVAYTEYSLLYLPHEIIARLGRRGIWSSDFVMPQDWRRRKKRI